MRLKETFVPDTGIHYAATVKVVEIQGRQVPIRVSPPIPPLKNMKQVCLLLTVITALGLPALAQDANVAIIELKPSANPSSPLAYEKTELSVKAGQKVKLTLNNSGGILPQPHNFLLLKPGKLDAVGALANAMLADPQGMAKSYIPEAAKSDILANTKLVQPNASETIEFTAPAEAGDYPYICTFPGHWMLMRGVMHVTK